MAAIAKTIGASTSAMYTPVTPPPASPPIEAYNVNDELTFGSGIFVGRCSVEICGTPRPQAPSDEDFTDSLQNGVTEYEHNSSYRAGAENVGSYTETNFVSGDTYDFIRTVHTPSFVSPAWFTLPAWDAGDIDGNTGNGSSAGIGRRFHRINLDGRFFGAEGAQRNSVSLLTEPHVPDDYVSVNFIPPPVSGWLPYYLGEACSTYEMQRCAIDNVNAVIAKNRTNVTVVCRVIRKDLGYAP